MPWRDNLHSRLVAWFKILLPVMALGLLSTLFLFSRNIDPTTTIPFAKLDLEERARTEQLTRPEFAGATREGDLIAFSAATARPDPDNRARALATDLSARIDLAAGGLITFTAKGGTVNDDEDQAQLSGDVVITTSTGYTVHTEHLITAMKRLHAETPGTVTGDGPPGHITAGRMVLDRPDGKPDAQLLFTDGVKLIYDPTKAGD